MSDIHLEREKKRIGKKLTTLFVKSGFKSIEIEGKHFKVVSYDAEFDLAFFYENILIILEYTTTIPRNVGDHIRPKAEVIRQLQTTRTPIIDFLSKQSVAFKALVNKYQADRITIKYIYYNTNGVDKRHKDRYGDAFYFVEPQILEYFSSLTKTIKKTSRYEIFRFLEIELDQVGSASSGESQKRYTAIVLPKGASGLEENYWLITFFIDPQTLLNQAYVLRKDGWQSGKFVYQRILEKKKIENMRKFLCDEGRVFVNNIIASLPIDLKLLNYDGSAKSDIVESDINKAIKVEIPIKHANVGIVDGQHRAFSYHEGDDKYERLISQMRTKQHLLVTGIVYPNATTEDERTKFEAQLFLEINDKQTKTKSSLKQVLYSIVQPFSDIGIAKAVASNLATTGPLSGLLEEGHFDKGKLKTASIVSFGIKYLTKLEGNDSLFKIWPERRKNLLKSKKSKALLDKYIEFCVKEINLYLEEAKILLSSQFWKLPSTPSTLNVTTVNGLLHSLRRIIENDDNRTKRHYKTKLVNLSSVEFSKHKSSHWRELGDEIYEKCF